MGQSEVWKKQRSGLAETLRQRQKSWLSAGDVEVDAEPAATGSAGVTKDDRQWLASQPEAGSRSIEE